MTTKPSRSQRSIDAEGRFRVRVTELGGTVLEPTWLGVNKPHRVICKVGHHVTPCPSSLHLGRGLCRACAGKDPATAERAFRLRIIELGGYLIEPMWLGCMTPHSVVCKNGHETKALPNTVQQGHGFCQICARNDPVTAEKAFHKRVTELGGVVIEAVYLGSKMPHRVICKAGHAAQPRPADVANGHGLCLICVGKDPVATERAFRKRVIELGGEIIEPVWLGSQVPCRIICPAGHKATPRPTSVLQGNGMCRSCAGRDPKLAWQQFKQRVVTLGGQVIEATWLGNNMPHRVTCRNGHIATPLPAGVQQGQGLCPICVGNDSATAWRRFRTQVAHSGGTVTEPKWLGCDTPHRIICKIGHETMVRPGSVRNGQGLCRTCAGKLWDVFYVVTNDTLARVKFGVTSGDTRHRLATHRRAGYRAVVKTITALVSAADLERAVVATLKLAGIPPVHGREYYDVSALPVILDVVDNWDVPSAKHPTAS